MHIIHTIVWISLSLSFSHLSIWYKYIVTRSYIYSHICIYIWIDVCACVCTCIIHKTLPNLILIHICPIFAPSFFSFTPSITPLVSKHIIWAVRANQQYREQKIISHTSINNYCKYIRTITFYCLYCSNYNHNKYLA